MQGSNSQRYKEILLSLIVVFLFVVTVTSLFFRYEDSDVYFLISNGRYILHKGIPHTMFWGLKPDLPTMVQQWGCSVWNYLFYAVFSEKGINLCKGITCILMTVGIYFLLIPFSVSKSKRFVVTVFASFFLSTNYILVRPYPITFLCCLALVGQSFIFFSSKERPNKEYIKYCIFVFFIYIFQSNWQCASLVILTCFSACFLFDRHGFNVRAALSFIPAFLGGLINPYGINAWTYTLRSVGATEVYTINEMRPLGFTELQLTLVIATIILYISYRKLWKIFPLWLHLMTCGSLLASLFAPRNTYMCIIPFSIIMLCGLSIYEINIEKLLRVLSPTLIAIILFVSVITDYRRSIDVPHGIIPDDAILFTHFNNGAYFINQGHQVYIDARPELYSEAFLGDDAYLQESFDACYNKSFDRNTFVDKYDFNYFATTGSDYMYYWCLDHCKMIYFDGMDTYIFEKS